MIKVKQETPNPMSVSVPDSDSTAVIEQFEDFCRLVARGQMKKESIDNFTRGIRQLIQYFGLPLGPPTAADIKRVVTMRLKYKLVHTPREEPRLVKGNITNNTFNYHLQCLRKWLAFHDIDTEQREFKKLLVSREKTARREKTKDDLLTPSDVEAIIEHHASPMYKAFTGVLWDTAARPKELFELDYDDVNRDAHGFILNIRESKSKTRQVRLITPLALRAFTSYYTMHDGTGPLFKDKSGKRLKHYHTTSVYKRASTRIGKKVYPYLFRKSASTYFLSSGLLDVTAIRVRLGHSNWSKTFERHYHQYFNSDYESAELRALGVVEEVAVKAPVKCWQCGLTIEEGQSHCANCHANATGKALLDDMKAVDSVKEELEAMRTAISLFADILAQDTEIKDRITALLDNGVKVDLEKMSVSSNGH